MILDRATKIEAVLAAAASTQPKVHVCYRDWNEEGEPTPPAMYLVALNSTTSVDILAAPVSNPTREPLRLSFYNDDSVTHTFTVRTDDGATERITIKATLLSTESLHFEAGRGWYGLDVNGNVKTAEAVSGLKTLHATTVTGYASDPSISIRLTKLDDVVTISIPTFTGTSDDTAKAIADAIPAAFRPAATTNIPIIAVDNGGTAAMGLATISTAGAISFYSTPASGGWTGSGTATVSRADGTYHV